MLLGTRSLLTGLHLHLLILGMYSRLSLGSLVSSRFAP
nr:MAG TPA: hypothetical protein [Caudoviricetes sp.]